MSGGLSACSSPPLYYGKISAKTQKNVATKRGDCFNLSWSSHSAPPISCVMNVRPRMTSFRCNSGAAPPPPPSDENENRSVLDAFFLGKALAETLNERIESTVGEFLSTIGRLQAEQLKQVQDFQEEVLERAKKSKEKAARETIEVQGLFPKTSVSVRAVSSATDADSLAFSDTTPNSGAPTSDKDHNSTSTTPPLEISIDD